MEDVEQITKNQNFTKDPKTGQNRLAKGNQIGRIKKRGYTLKDLTNVAREYEKTHNNTILKHYIEQLFTDNKLLEKYIDRYVPPKQEVKFEGDIKVKLPEELKEENGNS